MRLLVVDDSKAMRTIVIRTIRQAGSDVRFGLVTSEGSDDMRQTAMDAGALFLITKPFIPETFRDALGGVL